MEYIVSEGGKNKALEAITPFPACQHFISPPFEKMVGFGGSVLCVEVISLGVRHARNSVEERNGVRPTERQMASVMYPQTTSLGQTYRCTFWCDRNGKKREKAWQKVKKKSQRSTFSFHRPARRRSETSPKLPGYEGAKKVFLRSPSKHFFVSLSLSPVGYARKEWNGSVQESEAPLFVRRSATRYLATVFLGKF